MLEQVLQYYPLPSNTFFFTAFGNGLINNTWKVTSPLQTEAYILQRINRHVFNEPERIAHNVRIIADHVATEHPEYFFIAPLKTIHKEELVISSEGEYFRLYPFLIDSKTLDVVTTAGQAYEATRQFGLFTKILNDLDPTKLKITLPDFHNLTLRYRQFLLAIKNGNKDRIQKSKELINYLAQQQFLVEQFNGIQKNPEFKLRVTHHDTKISNVLFDSVEQGVAVIDLDTVMPGYFISDVGDMMRTYLSPVSEEESQFEKITIREDIFKAIIEGYLGQMHETLTKTEKQFIVYAGKFLIYMQAIRFLTDYLLGDIYYGARYEDHNLIRAQNQSHLLLQYTQKEKDLLRIVRQLNRAFV